MHLFLTSVLPFIAHNHASAAAFLTCRHHNFHASIIPEFLSDEERVKSFFEARQQNQLEVDEEETLYKNLYNLFVQTPLMQFSPSLVLRQRDCVESILKPLLATKYFTRSLQRCSIRSHAPLTNDLLQGLSKVQSLTKLDLSWSANEHLEIIINSFSSLETLTIYYANSLDPEIAISMNSPAPPATKTLRSLTMGCIDPLFTAQFVPHFSNLRKLELSSSCMFPELDLLHFSSSLLLLKDMSLTKFNLKNTESIKNLVHLSTLRFGECRIPDLSFLTQENSLPHLTELCIDCCDGLSTPSSFACLAHAPNLHVLEAHSYEFDDECLQYFENMVHLRKLDLSYSNIVGNGRSLKTLMQNLVQLEDLNLSECDIGSQSAIARALYSTHSRLRVLNFKNCNVVDDDLNGIGALKNTLEVLDLSDNYELTSEGLVHCRDLAKLKKLNMFSNNRIDDLSALKDCLHLEELDVSHCTGLNDDSFLVFSEEPNSFPNCRILDLSFCVLTEKVFEHLAKNNHVVCQLKELDVEGMCSIFLSSSTARNNLYKLKGLRELRGMFSWLAKDVLNFGVLRNLKNLNTIEYYCQ